MSKQTIVAQDHNEISDDTLQTVAGGVQSSVPMVAAQPYAQTFSGPTVAVPSYGLPKASQPATIAVLPSTLSKGI
jgi:hypothetical protein